MRHRWISYALAALLALGALGALFVLEGPGFEADTMAHLQWGKQLASGQALARTNVANTSPKVLPLLLSAAGHLLPGERAGEWFFAAVTAIAGAGVAVLTMALARRITDSAWAGILAWGLTLGHMTFLRYVLNGQSCVWAALFILWALVVALREEPCGRTWLGAGILVFLAGLCRPDASAIGGALALLALLRLGWRRPGWPIALLVLGLASAGATLLLHRIGFGSFSYNLELAVADTQLLQSNLPNLHVGFAKRVAATLLYLTNRSWVLILFAGLGAGLVFGLPQRRRFVGLLLFPLATCAFQWLLVARKIWFNERIFYYIGFILIALAAAGAARLARWAAEREEFLAPLPPGWRSAGMAALVLAALAPTYATRPFPKASGDFASVCEMAEFVASQVAKGKATPPFVATNMTGHVFYRLGLSQDGNAIMAIKLLHGDKKLPDGVDWCLVDAGDGSWELPPEWGMVEVWTASSGRARVFHRGPLEE